MEGGDERVEGAPGAHGVLGNVRSRVRTSLISDGLIKT